MAVPALGNERPWASCSHTHAIVIKQYNLVPVVRLGRQPLWCCSGHASQT